MTDQEKLSGKVAVSTIVTPGPGGITWAQFGKSLILAVIAAVFPIIIDSWNTGSFTVDWKHVGTVAGSTALAYILNKLGAPMQQVTTFKKQ